MPLETSAIAQILRALFPPSLLVHVGWGNGLGDLTQWTAWQVPHAFIIEAEESKLAACQAQALALAQANGQTAPSWQTIHATLAAQGAEQPYHVASNPSESGLMPTESLQHAWPHLQTVASPTVLTRSLDEVWQDISLSLHLAASSQSTWLIIDCLPAADILAGGVAVLQSAQVVCARSLLANRALLCDQMRAAGWIEVSWAESQHPAFGHAWFSRDTGLLLESAAKRQAQLTAERDALAKAKEAETQAKTDLQTQLETLTKDRFELQAKLTQQIQSQDELQSELDKAIQRQAQLTAERDALAKAKDEESLQLAQLHEKEIAKFLDQAGQEKKSRADLQKQVDQSMGKVANQQLELQSLHSQLDSQARATTLLDQRNTELTQLHAQLLEAQKRQMLMNDALLKSETQIELLKDLCLREPGI